METAERMERFEYCGVLAEEAVSLPEAMSHHGAHRIDAGVPRARSSMVDVADSIIILDSPLVHRFLNYIFII